MSATVRPRPRAAEGAPLGLRRAERAFARLLRAVPIACLAALFGVLLLNIASRELGLFALAWLDEVVEALFAWMVFIGAAALWRDGEHFRVDWLEGRAGRAGARALRVLVGLLAAAFLFAMTWKGIDLASRSRAVTPILGWPVAWTYAAIPVSGAIMLAYTARDLWRALRPVPDPIHSAEPS